MLTSVLALVLTSTALTGCGAASKNASSQVYMAETTAAYDAASGAADGMPASFSKSATADFAPEAEASSGDSGSVQLSQNDVLSQNPEENPDANPTESENASAEASKAPIERKLIRNVNMDLETQEFDALTKSISDAVTSFGGYIQQSDVSGNSLNWSGDRSSRYSTITSHPISWMIFSPKYPARAMSPTKMKACRMSPCSTPTSLAGRKPSRWNRNACGHFWKKQSPLMLSLRWNHGFPKSATS